MGIRVRRAFAGSIVALLLSVSPLAAACDLSCAFASMNSDCHSRQIESQDSTSSDMKMDGMATDGMTMPEMSNNEVQQIAPAISEPNTSHPSIGEMGPCERQSCDTGSIDSAGTGRSLDLHSYSLHAVTETFRDGDALALFRGARDDIATHQVRDGIPPYPSLRI